MDTPHQNCACVFCERVRQAVETTASWDKKHQKCIDKIAAGLGPTPKPPRKIVGSLLDVREPATTFTEKYFNHPSGQWYWKVCPCGAQHLRIRDDATTQNAQG